MNKIILTIALALSIHAAEIKTYKNGNTYPIIEKNVIELFKEHVVANKDMIDRKAIQEREEFAHIKFKNNDESDSVAVGLAFILKSFGETKWLKN